MTSSDWITVVGAAITIVCTFVTIAQARSALKSSRTAKAAMAAVQLAAVAERLKSAQEHIRDVAPDRVTQRGFKIGNRIDLIRREFDNALSALPKSGVGSDARKQLANAQVELNFYQTSLSLVPDALSWQKLQALVQDTVSDLTSKSFSVGDENGE